MGKRNHPFLLTIQYSINTKFITNSRGKNSPIHCSPACWAGWTCPANAPPVARSAGIIVTTPDSVSKRCKSTRFPISFLHVFMEGIKQRFPI